MPLNRLSDHQCRSAKPAEKPLKLFDGGGMFLYVTPKGAKVWRLAYRLHGKPQTAVLGDYPLVTLADARAKRDELKKGLLKGVAPKRRTGQPTFKAACESYWSGRKDLSDSYRECALRGLALHLWPALGDRLVGSISREDMLDALVALDSRGKHVYVRKVRVWAGQVFEWSIEHKHAEANPCASIRPKRAFGSSKVKSHASLELTDVPALMQRLALEDDLQSVLACRLLAYSWTRTDELRFMEWREVEGGLWRIPKERMKKDRDHLVPLPKQALPILETLKMRARGSKYVFPAEHRLDRPMSENAVLALLYRLGYKGKMTGHGWRSVASTWANENGFNRDAIERQLAHAPDDKVRSAYNRAEFMPERKRMMQAFADWLDRQSVLPQG